MASLMAKKTELPINKGGSPTAYKKQYKDYVNSLLPRTLFKSYLRRIYSPWIGSTRQNRYIKLSWYISKTG